VEIIFDCGIYLPEIDLWLDPTRGRPRAVVSHAHSDHFGRNDEFIVTPETAALLRHRYRPRGRMAEQCFGERRDFGDFALTLYPAGHVLGSAQALIEHRGERLLYSGDLKLTPRHTAEACEVPQAETLIVEATFGRPRYVFPPSQEVIAGILSFCRNVLAKGETPVLFAYSLGKGQEVLRALAGAGFAIAVHGTTFGVAEVYTRLGVEFPVHERLDDCDLRGRVVICPPQTRRTAMFNQIARPRTALVSGWAIDRGARWRYGVDAAFPLSDHADYNELVEYVRLVNPTRVFTIFGSEGEFAADLRTRGYDAQPLKSTMQLQMFAR
jgi:Cft2 family RNA processing exonuclease